MSAVGFFHNHQAIGRCEYIPAQLFTDRLKSDLNSAAFIAQHSLKTSQWTCNGNFETNRSYCTYRVS